MLSLLYYQLISWCRWVQIYFCYRNTKLSYPLSFGGETQDLSRLITTSLKIMMSLSRLCASGSGSRSFHEWQVVHIKEMIKTSLAPKMLYLVNLQSTSSDNGGVMFSAALGHTVFRKLSSELVCTHLDTLWYRYGLNLLGVITIPHCLWGFYKFITPCKASPGNVTICWFWCQGYMVCWMFVGLMLYL